MGLIKRIEVVDQEFATVTYQSFNFVLYFTQSINILKEALGLQ